MSIYSGPNLSTTGLVFYLDAFNYKSWNVGRQTWKDLSIQKNNATFVSEPALDNVVGAFNFANGNSQHVTYPVPTSGADFGFGTGDFTLECWIYPQSFSTYTHMIAMPSQSTFALKANVTDGAIYFYSPTFDTFPIAGWTLALNQWNYVAFKRQSGVAYAYLNGELKGTKAGFTNNIANQSLNIRNGAPSEFSQCKIRSVSIYNRALSDSEIKKHELSFRGRTYAPPTVTAALSAVQSISSRAVEIGDQFLPFRPITGSGGFGEYSYSISPALPSGITINSQTGFISGIGASLVTSSTRTVSVRDALGTTATNTFSFSVAAPAIVLTVAIPVSDIPVNQTVSFIPVTAAGGFGTLTYGLNPALPTGLNFNTADGRISGTPTALISTTTYTVTVTDQASQSVNTTFTLRVFPAPISTILEIPVVELFANSPADVRPVSASGGFGTLTYSINPALPSGLVISGTTGTITGTPTGALATSNRTITATDQTTPTAQTSSQVFSLTVSNALYVFSSFTFTAAGTFGHTGPTQQTLLNSYNTVQNPWLTNTSFYTVQTQGIQEWTVPATGTYRIQAVGASGGIHSGNYFPGFPGAGATVQADVSLTGGEKIYIVVGQKPSSTTAGSANGAGGGGGTWLYRGTSATNGIGGAGLIMVAGGGGGTGHGNNLTSAGNGKGGSSSINSNEATVDETFGVGANSRLTGGSAGNFGVSLGGRASTVDSFGWGGGGAGWTGDGQGANNSTGRGGTRFVGGISEDDVGQYGGFGGGGGAGGSGNSGGGGGGYTGGGGGNGWNNIRFGGGGGGGSFAIAGATNMTMTAGLGGISYPDTANGFVVITRL
jgi:hypothetical protein